MKSGLGQLPGTSQLSTQGKVLPFELLSEMLFSVPALASCWGLFLHDGLLHYSPPRVAHRDFFLGCGLVWTLRPGVVEEVVLFIWRFGQPKWALESGVAP